MNGHPPVPQSVAGASLKGRMAEETVPAWQGFLEPLGAAPNVGKLEAPPFGVAQCLGTGL